MSKHGIAAGLLLDFLHLLVLEACWLTLVDFYVQAVLLHILDTGVGLGTGCMLGSALKSFQTKLAMACLAGLLLLIVGYACLHAISVQNSYSSMHYS